MSVPSNTFQVYTQNNIREDLINAVYNVDPFKTPFLNMAKKGKATQTKHEWSTDALDAQDTTNAAVEGDNPTNKSITAASRYSNYTQISTKTIQISGTSQVVDASGGTNKMGYQLLKKSKELKRDMEGILTANIASAVGTSSTARKLAGLPTWLTTNTVKQTGGTPAGADPSAPDGTHTRTDNSTTTALTETMIKTLVASIYNNSGDCPEYALVSPANKQIVSGLSGPGTRYIEVEDAVLRTKVDVYESDFGDIKMIPDIFLARSRDTFWVNPQYVKVAYLRPFQTIPLAKTGDSDQKMLLTEYTLEVGNQKALGGIYDTTG